MINLPRLQQAAPLVTENFTPSSAFHIWWDTFAKNLEQILTDQSSQLAAITALQADQTAQLASITALQSDMTDRITEITNIQNDLVTQLAAITAAQAAADAADTKARTVTVSDKISASATVPTSVLSAVDAGTDATITVAAHTRIYGDSTTVTIGSPVNLTGLAYSTTYGIYYDDATATTNTPTYHATSILSAAMPNFAVGRHYMGQVTTPASGGGGTSGGMIPPGGGGPYP